VLLLLSVAAAVAACLTSLVVLLPSFRLITLLVVLLWVASPGIVLGWRLYGGSRGGGIAAVLVGPAWGYVLTSLVVLGLWAAGVRSFGWLMVAPAVAVVAIWPAGALKRSLAVPLFTRADVAALSIVALAVPVIVARPYSRVGIDLPEGRAYRAYFTADFVWEMAVAAEVSKGDVPPRNPYYRNDDLHYYWLMHLLPAAEHRHAGRSIPLEKILLVNAFAIGLAFVGFFYFFVRHFVERASAAAAACVGVIFCSSFEGTDRLIDIWRRGGSLEELRYLNIDAVGNWIYHGMKVDGLQRLLLYQPQHQLGYALGFSALLLLLQARDCSRAALLFLAGVFLGMSLLMSSPAAGMLAAAVGIYESIQLIRARQWRAFLPCALAGAVPIAAAVVLGNVLHYVDTKSPGNPLVTFGLNPLAVKALGLTIFLNFGPVLIVAALGVVAVIWRGSATRFVPLAIALAVCAFFYFLVDVPDHQGVYIAWRASHLAFIALAPFCGYALQEWWGAGQWRRPTIVVVALVVAVLALPMPIIDLYNSQDVANRAQGPGFRWTVLLTKGEVAGLDWIRQSTARDARVQVEPEVRGRDTWAYVPAFAERRMSAGLPIGMIPLAKYEKASAEIKQAYLAPSAEDAYDRALKLCIDYLVIGPPERTAYPRLQPLLDASPQLFAPTFRNDALAVYAVSGSWNREGCSH